MDTSDTRPTPEALRGAPGFLVRRLYQAYTAAWVRLVDPTLTGPQFAVLTAVSVHPRVDQGTLAASVCLDRSTMADVCRRLEDRGLLRRETAPGDGRRKLLELTDHGAGVLTQITARVEDLNSALLDRDEETLDQDEETKALLRRIERLVERWETMADAEPV